jgi:hypothetical protein
MKEVANRGNLFISEQMQSVLFECDRDARESVIELGAQAIDHGNDRGRNAGGDQAVLNCGSAGLILQKCNDNDIGH